MFSCGMKTFNSFSKKKKKNALEITKTVAGVFMILNHFQTCNIKPVEFQKLYFD